MRLASNILLARLLLPDAFAMVSISVLILTGVEMVSDVGIAIMALRHGTLDAEREARLWTMKFIRGIGLALFVFAIAGPIAHLYHNEELGHVVRALSLVSALQGAQSLYPILALQRRDLRPSFYIDVGGRVIGTMTSVGFAIASPTVWAIVAGMLVQSVFAVLASHIMAGRRPRFVFDPAFMRGEWRGGRWIQLASTLTLIGMQIDKALFPLLFGISVFGLYTIGSTFALIPAQITQKWSASVFYPLMTTMLKQGEAARSQLLRIRFAMLLYSAVITTAMAAVAPSFFILLYKPIYHEAARFAQLLALGVFFDVAESSLRHFPLVDGTYRYEVQPVVLRILMFLILAMGFHALGGGAASYALSYVLAMAISYFFMLTIDTHRGYLRPYADLRLAGAVLMVQLLIYALPLPRMTWVVAMMTGFAVAVVAGAALLAIYARYGFPSLSADASHDDQPVAE
ncbi:MAG: oligosaccharide flippase family protein [Sphingomonas bacterium]